MENKTEIELVKKVLQVQEVTEKEIRELGGVYNASDWNARISRMLSYGPIKFYLSPKDTTFEYNRFFAVYNAEEINFFNELSPYSSRITSNGFCRITLNDKGEVFRHLLKDSNGNVGRCANDKPNRKIMAENSKKFGTIYANNF